jgi:hypothetical protein
MSNSNVVVPPELIPLITEREKVWADVERSQKLSAEVGQLSSSVPNCAPAELQLRFGTDSTPLTELDTVLPMLKEKIETTRKLNTEKEGCFAEIEAIKRREKMTITIGVIVGVVILIVLIFVLIGLLSRS